MVWQWDQASFKKAPQLEKVSCKGPFHPVSRKPITLIVFKWLCGYPVSVCSCKRSPLENYESVDFMAFSRAAVMVHIPPHFLVRNIKSLTIRSFLTQKSRRLANDPSKLDSENFFFLMPQAKPPAAPVQFWPSGEPLSGRPWMKPAESFGGNACPAVSPKRLVPFLWGSKNKHENRNGCLGAEDISTSPLHNLLLLGEAMFPTMCGLQNSSIPFLKRKEGVGKKERLGKEGEVYATFPQSPWPFRFLSTGWYPTHQVKV